jgi:hypothetical protein
MLEKQIEKAVCDYAKSKGFLVYKFTSPNRRSVPDRMFIRAGLVFFIEFKRAGAKPTAMQDREAQKIAAQDINVYFVDDIEMGKSIIDTLC